MTYREKIYSGYVSTHTVHLYGETSIDAIRKQFSVWKKYYSRFLPKDRSAKIIDLGCGNGGFIYYLKHLGYANSSGIDISPEQIEVAKNLGIKDVECVDIMSYLKDRKECCDFLIARDVIEHFNKNEIINILTVLFESLRRGGELIIQTPNAEGPFGSRYRYWDFTHEVAFTQSSLRSILMATGFREVTAYPAGPVPKGVVSTIRLIVWKILDLMLRFYMLVETGSPEGIFTQNIIAVAKK